MTEPNQRFTQLYLDMYDDLLDYAAVVLDSFPLAEEAVQETFERAFQRQEELFGSSRPDGWVMNLLKTVLAGIQDERAADCDLVQRYIAAHYRDLSSTEDSICIEVLYHDIAQTEELKLIRELALEGRSYLEMAQQRGISIPACRKRVQRAREVLRRKMMK